MSSIKNEIVVITGAAKGIGAATANAFLALGAKLALLDISLPSQTLCDLPSERSLYISCDVSNGDQVKRAFGEIEEKFGAVDILVNNAGIQRYNTVTETSEQEWDQVIGVNLKSAFLCAKYAIALMLKGGHGVVINVSSIQAFLSQQKVAAYTTSKTALLGLTRSIAVDYAPQVRCVAVCPGTVDTPMLREAIELSEDPQKVLKECYDMHPLGRIATPEEIADLIVYLSSDKAGFITGQAIRIDGGLGLSLAGSKQS